MQVQYRFDVKSKLVVATWHRDDHYPGELMAVPRPGAVYEDDVVLLVTMLGGHSRQNHDKECFGMLSQL